MGHYNGFGGKVEKYETIGEAAVRETFEEAGIEALDPQEIGTIDFHTHQDEEIRVHVFKAIKFSGQISESEEMRPQWFALDKIPYHKMWADDSYWLPLLIADKKFKARFIFDRADHIAENNIELVEQLKN